MKAPASVDRPRGDARRRAWDPALHFARRGDPLRDAFPGRRPLLPWRGGDPVAAEAVASTWAALRRRPRSTPAVGYVHVPFCAGHCTFCGFYRNGSGHPARGRYQELVVSELGLEGEAGLREGPPLEALYFGGGTPTELDTRAIVSLVRAARSRLPLADDAEVTLEARALHCDVAKLHACVDAGVNRISVGVQSFDTGVRRALGRRTDGASLLAFLAELRRDARAILVIDLILGLPGQSMDVWRRDLDTCLALGPDGVDLYTLSLHPGVPLFRMAARNRVAAHADVPAQAEMYRVGVATLEGAGWTQLSQAHFASGPRERNLYNRRIKAGTPCLGYGAGAGGTHAGFSYAIEPELTPYEQGLVRGERPLAGLARLPATHGAESLVVDGIEHGSLDLSSLCQMDRDFAARAAPLLEQWREIGLVELNGSTVVPTLPGRFWQSNLITGLTECIRSGTTEEGEPS